MKRFKKFIASLLAVTMVAAPMTVFGQAPVNLGGTATLINPVFSILLPTAPVLRLNPLGLMGQDQISSNWFVIANRSNVPVEISMFIGTQTVAAPTGTNPDNRVTFRDGDFNPDTWEEASEREAQLFIRWSDNRVARVGEPAAIRPFLHTTTPAIAVEHATGWDFHAAVVDIPIHEELAGGATAAAVIGHDDPDGTLLTILLNEQIYVFNPAGAAVIAGYAGDDAPTTRPASLSENFRPFVAAGAAATLPIPKFSDQYAAFQFYGYLNPLATYVANSVTARIVFDFTPIAPSVWAAERERAGTATYFWADLDAVENSINVFEGHRGDGTP